jgi:hypothetical protein
VTPIWYFSQYGSILKKIGILEEDGGSIKKSRRLKAGVMGNVAFRKKVS